MIVQYSLICIGSKECKNIQNCKVKQSHKKAAAAPCFTTCYPLSFGRVLALALLIKLSLVMQKTEYLPPLHHFQISIRHFSL
ncbi:hypothetical protein EGR_06315 [Echinococcus granulosus]|uniref:Uncharacterized protein n=1 Tax=Echinococcus granulosus TaxID=6210 RepID=W6UD75_ECHGR|nr:hypothetical protein EGR_06315 [Echinococcus granulosus]EUB58766.1 hypothetical protein EGR_06315 [Echinococcus granulosus]